MDVVSLSPKRAKDDTSSPGETQRLDSAKHQAHILHNTKRGACKTLSVILEE